MTPRGVRLRRTRGWRLPDSAKVVARPSRYGNPWRIGETFLGETLDRDAAVALHADGLALGLDVGDPLVVAAALTLVGRDLACWCPEDAPCHRTAWISAARLVEQVVEDSADWD